METFDELKSKITYENKTIIGVFGLIIVFTFLYFNLLNGIYTILDIIFLIFPFIFLIIPSPTIKNSKILGVAAIIISLVFLMIMIVTIFQFIHYCLFGFNYFESPFKADYTMLFIQMIITLIIRFYGLFCAFLLTIKTEPNRPKTIFSFTNNNMSKNNATNFDKYCSECGHGLMNDAKFCPGCGSDLNVKVKEISVEDN